MARRLNRSQALVLAFFGAVWVTLLGIVILAILAPGIYVKAMGAPRALERPAAIGLFAFVTLLIAVLAAGVVQRSRWVFWLIVLAFVAGLLRAPAAILELTGTLPAGGPTWYVLLQAVIGLVQFGIGLALLVGYRKSGVWGAF